MCVYVHIRWLPHVKLRVSVRALLLVPHLHRPTPSCRLPDCMHITINSTHRQHASSIACSAGEVAGQLG
jgi:hypothetical protein